MDNRITLTEQELHGIIRESVNRILKEYYDKDFLVGIDSIDNKSISMHIQNMIPSGNRVSVNSPYKAVRQLVLYFSREGAAKHGGRLTKDVVNHIMKDNVLREKIMALTKEDSKILDLIYGKNRLVGKPLMQQVVWHLDEISSLLVEINDLIEKSNVKNYFGHTEALKGSDDGKRIGLSTIMYKAFMGINEIKQQIKNMQAILDKGKDAFSYWTGKTARR